MSSEEKRFDVIVAGAGPAGSSLAQRLARRGFRTAVLDRKRFPRWKPCGEFLSPACLPLLDELGVRAALAARHPMPVFGMRILGFGHRTEGRYASVGRSVAPAAHGHALRREVFDELLLRAAERSGAEFLEGFAVHDLLRDPGGRIAGVLATAPDGDTLPLRARWTIGADGVRSTVARCLGVQHRLPWLDKFALTTRFRGVPVFETAEVHLFEGGYFAAAPVDDGLFSLNLVLDRPLLRRRTGDWDAFLAEHLVKAPELRRRLSGARRTDPVRGVGPLAWTTTHQVFPGAALVGDACGYVDPITGEGIWFALRGAALLADALERALDHPSEAVRAMQRYARLRRREVGARLGMCRLLQRGLRRAPVRRTVLRLLAGHRGLADLLVSVTGDYVRLRELARPSVWLGAVRTGAAGGR